MSRTDSDDAARHQLLLVNAGLIKDYWLVATAAVIFYDFGEVKFLTCSTNAHSISALTFDMEVRCHHFHIWRERQGKMRYNVFLVEAFLGTSTVQTLIEYL